MLDTESFLVPDYGGFNGLLIEGSLKSLRLGGVISVDRDDNHRMAVVGVTVQRKHRVFQPALSVAVTRIENRLTDSACNDGKVGLTTAVRYAGGYTSVEVAGQSGDFGFA